MPLTHACHGLCAHAHTHMNPTPESFQQCRMDNFRSLSATEAATKSLAAPCWPLTHCTTRLPPKPCPTPPHPDMVMWTGQPVPCDDLSLLTGRLIFFFY